MPPADVSQEEPPYRTLSETELQWTARFESLKERGYLLRPRYRPDWVPSEVPISSHPNEDHQPILGENLDAARIADGRPVYLKCVNKNSKELEITRLLSSEGLKEDPRNHSVPLLDVLDDPLDPNVAILVLPILRSIIRPHFFAVREAVDFIVQILEGLVFMHEHGVAHRDCYEENVMMDARALFPQGWHPQNIFLHADGSIRMFQEPTRAQVGGVRYYFIDFGISTLGESSTVGLDGLIRSPELSLNVPYDPYKLDVYILGKLFENLFTVQAEDMPWLKTLTDRMCRVDPAQRVTASEALKIFEELRASIDPYEMSQRLHYYNQPEGRWTRWYHDVLYRLKDAWWLAHPPAPLGPLP